MESNLRDNRSIVVRARDYLVETVTSKAYWVDTLTTTSWFLPVFAFSELVFRDYSGWETAKRRAIAFGIGLFSNRPLCKVRDIWRRDVFGVDEYNPGRKGPLADTSLVLGLTPIIYGAVLGLSSIGEGKTFVENFNACWQGSAFAISTLPLFFKYLKSNRKRFGTLPLEKAFD